MAASGGFLAWAVLRPARPEPRPAPVPPPASPRPASPTPSPVALPSPEPVVSEPISPDPGGRVYWGAFREGAPLDPGLLDSLEEDAGEPPSILMWYRYWDARPLFDAEAAEDLLGRGIVPMVTWEPWDAERREGGPNQPAYSLRRIVAGAYDGYIRRYARSVRAYGDPVMLRPFHEMDGDWYPWGGTVNGNTPEDLVAAWRHIHRIFREVGAANVTWVWSVNHVSVPAVPENAMERYWPGRRFVDWIGISGFNWGPTQPGTSWVDFHAVYARRYRELLRFRRPIMLTEIGAPEIGGDKAAWIRESVRSMLREYPRIRGFVWYDQKSSHRRDFRFGSSPRALRAFRRAVARPRVLGGPHAYPEAVRVSAMHQQTRLR